MNFWKQLELEWKILILACLVFVAFAWPIQNLFVSRFVNTLNQSIDPNLEMILRSQLNSGDSLTNTQAIVASIQRNKQWKALIPIIIDEQKQTIIIFSFGLFVLLFILALWILKGLTKPLKSLAHTVELIGKGEKANVTSKSGGALGTVEKAVVDLQEELVVLREKSRIQGMESAWQDIARIMAHEIKNPLTPIRLTLDRIEEKTTNDLIIAPKELSTFLIRFNTQVDTLERLVNQFRSFSREPEVNCREVSSEKLIRSIADDMARKIITTINGTAKIYTDPYLLNQVLLNLWKNSLEANADRIDVLIVKKNEKTEIRIHDNGMGIKKEDLERVWLPYVTLKKGGTGLGLPVVKKIVETMQGEVTLESKTTGPDSGLTVILLFPETQSGE